MADFLVQRTRKRAFFMAEQLTARQFLGNRATVHRDERLVAAFAALVYLVGNGFLARPTLAVNDDAEIGWRHQINLFDEILGYLAFAEDITDR